MNYDPNAAAVRQTDSFSCSIATAAFMLESIGEDVSYPSLESLILGAGLVTGDDGLLVGSAGPLADWIAARYGLTTGHMMPVTWDWLQEHAGTMPVGIGAGRPFYHWVAVRGIDGEGNLLLSNPAPTWFSVGDVMTETEFRTYSPFACWYIEVTEDEDMARVDELERQVQDAVNLLGNIQGDYADAVEAAIHDAMAEPDTEQRNADLSAALAALNTIRNGG